MPGGLSWRWALEYCWCCQAYRPYVASALSGVTTLEHLNGTRLKWQNIMSFRNFEGKLYAEHGKMLKNIFLGVRNWSLSPCSIS